MEQPSKRFYYGTRAELKPRDLIKPSNPSDVGERDRMTTYVYLTHNLDAAIWEAEIAAGEGPGRVYIVEPIGTIEDTSTWTDKKSPGHPSMSYCSRAPLRVMGEVTEWQGIPLKRSKPCMTALNDLSGLVLSQLTTERSRPD